VRFADTRWLPGDWTKALFIFERILVYSAGRSGEFVAQSIKAALNQTDFASRGASRWYDERTNADAATDLDRLVGEHPANWIVWSSQVAKWDLRGGIAASRLRLELIDGTRRKVLWGRISNSLPAVRSALERALSQSPARPPRAIR
jgi:hypothetical protein